MFSRRGLPLLNTGRRQPLSEGSHPANLFKTTPPRKTVPQHHLSLAQGWMGFFRRLQRKVHHTSEGETFIVWLRFGADFALGVVHDLRWTPVMAPTRCWGQACFPGWVGGGSDGQPRSHSASTIPPSNLTSMKALPLMMRPRQRWEGVRLAPKTGQTRESGHPGGSGDSLGERGTDGFAPARQPALLS